MSKSQVLSIEEVKKRIDTKTNGNFILVGGYINRYTPVKVKHKCGELIEAQLRPICEGRVSCKPCLLKEKISAFRSLVESSNKYKLIDDYINDTTKLSIMCLSCTNKFTMSPNLFKQGSGCNICATKKRNKSLSNASTIQELFDGISTGYTVLNLGDYENNQTQLRLIHQMCGTEFSTTLKIFRNGKRCPCYKKDSRNSAGSIKIEEFLTDNNIQFEKEKKFDGCKNERHLKFDFFIPDMNLIIEYDGKQHFLETSMFSRDGQFEKTKENDLIKNNFCKNSNINIIRIKFTEYKNIETILTDKIINKRSTTIPDTGVGSSDPIQEPPL